MSPAPAPPALSTAPSPARLDAAEAHDLRVLARSTMTATTATTAPAPDGVNPVSAFIALHPALDAFLAQRAPRPAHVVHLAQELHLTGALVPATYDVGHELVEVRPDPRGCRVRVRSTLTDQDGSPAARAVADVLLGGVDPADVRADASPAAPQPPRPAVRALPGAGPEVRTAVITPATTARYAAVSHDENPIHLDDDAARRAGFDGPIAHGMSVVAVACEAAADALADGDVSRLRALGVRFSAPVRCGDEITVELSATADPRVHALRVLTAAGPALKSGWIEIEGPEPS
ncbi:MaoC family dehydratase [Sanguibacter suaedae]|uniref:MaoC family dehydratase n=1 Tax=Sanguibacter suaedae TaxID=2795737 RepID=A0A934IAN7_9MICO|nr:MaoC family dehydratase [Sanguibacter suaedae]MBI9115250.1 MaoC family dehydratase [Sanguibacter suaedae]